MAEILMIFKEEDLPLLPEGYTTKVAAEVAGADHKTTVSAQNHPYYWVGKRRKYVYVFGSDVENSAAGEYDMIRVSKEDWEAYRGNGD
jgi:hypothetical protein